MATSFLLLLCGILFFSLTSFAHRPNIMLGPSTTIKQACEATRYPEPCQWSVNNALNGSREEPSDIVQAAFSVSADNLQAGRKMVQAIVRASTKSKSRTKVAETCLKGLSISEYLTTSASYAVAKGKLRDARAWGSAALTYQHDCSYNLNNYSNIDIVQNTMKFFDTTFTVTTSNALSLLQAFDVVGPNVASWTPPRTERDGFWDHYHAYNSKTFDPMYDFARFKADLTVCKNVSQGCLSTVQAAVEAAPNNLRGERRHIIKIKEGVYNETVRVHYNKTNLVFLGDGIGKTVITGSLNTGIVGITTYESATVGVLGRGFMASGITFQNTAGSEMHPAVAFRSSSDFSFIENCEFIGNQNTLYAHSLRQFYKSCHIEGNVDFIFGNAAAVFQNCTILVRPRQVNPDKGESNAISAHGRTDPVQTTGFVFLDSLINGTLDYLKLYQSNSSIHKNYLGRPWKMYSRTVYINCTMEKIISPEGWTPFDKDFAISTLFYGEFNNSGAGAGAGAGNVSRRVLWSTKIPEEYVPLYYVDKFLEGDDWTGYDF
ncbi:hypothetical protein RND81_03G006000 [Saponaria officinalis]|uniref:pectinesterase n=1 Tax=Saponaria officinalis TaxID=3572 RepID=A0AAW1M4A6_SAPOF